MSSRETNSEDHSSNNGSDFLFFKNSFIQGLVSPKLSAKALEELKELDQLLQKAKLDKDSGSTTAGVIELDGRKYFLKRYNNKNFKRKLKNSIRQTRPFKVLKTSQVVRKSGVFAPEVYAALNYRRGLLIESSYLLCSVLETAQPANQTIEKITGKENSNQFIDRACHTLVKIHDAGILHGDVKISNILIIANDDNCYKTGLLDFDGSKCYSEALSERRRIRDLARLISSYLLTCKHRELPVKNLKELSLCFAKKYHEISGIDLFGQRLLQRAEYLCKRVRK